jgi:hypothetical protein
MRFTIHSLLIVLTVLLIVVAVKMLKGTLPVPKVLSSIPVCPICKGGYIDG